MAHLVFLLNLPKGNLNKMKAKSYKIRSAVTWEYFMTHACYSEWRGRKGLVYAYNPIWDNSKIIYGVIFRPLISTKTTWTAIRNIS